MAGRLDSLWLPFSSFKSGGASEKAGAAHDVVCAAGAAAGGYWVLGTGVGFNSQQIISI